MGHGRGRRESCDIIVWHKKNTKKKFMKVIFIISVVSDYLLCCNKKRHFELGFSDDKKALCLLLL